MTRRVVLMAVVALVGLVLVYLSRFWSLDLWAREGLFDIEALRPQGDLVARWLRGTMAAPFATLIWAAGAFLVLSLLQSVIDRLWPPKGDDHD